MKNTKDIYGDGHGFVAVPVQEKKLVEVVDLAPSWVTAVEIYMAVLEDGTEQGKETARAEIRRLASIADAVIAEQKKGKSDATQG